jgi:hypothetical protein
MGGLRGEDLIQLAKAKSGFLDSAELPLKGGNSAPLEMTEFLAEFLCVKSG